MEPKRPLMMKISAACMVLILAVLAPLAAVLSAQNVDPPPRISFQISTGSTSGTYLSVGVLLAQLLSHPPGVARCEQAGLCGPLGLIVTTRASEGSVANVLAVNQGEVSSGLAQSDVVALAVTGEGPFKKAGPARQLRVIAHLFSEDVHLFAVKDAGIASVAELRGKRVGLGSEGSGTIMTARAILAANGLSEKTVIPNYERPEQAISLLRERKLDAIFVVGAAPINVAEPLMSDEGVILVPIDGAGRERLLKRHAAFAEAMIPAGTYAGRGAVPTVSVATLWITDASQPEALIYGIVKALYNPANRPMIEAQHLKPHALDPALAAAGVEGLLHPGAARYYQETGLLKASGTAQGDPPAPPVANAASKP